MQVLPVRTKVQTNQTQGGRNRLPQQHQTSNQRLPPSRPQPMPSRHNTLPLPTTNQTIRTTQQASRSTQLHSNIQVIPQRLRLQQRIKARHRQTRQQYQPTHLIQASKLSQHSQPIKRLMPIPSLLSHNKRRRTRNNLRLHRPLQRQPIHLHLPGKLLPLQHTRHLNRTRHQVSNQHQLRRVHPPPTTSRHKQKRIKQPP